MAFFVLVQVFSLNNAWYCVTRAPILYFIRSWAALSFICEWVSQSVRHPWHLTRSPLFAIYKGINALYWPSIINYQLLPTHYTASSSRNAQLSQLDLVIYDFSDHLNVQLVQNVVCIKPQPVFWRIQWKRVFEKLEGVYVANVVRQDVTTSKLQFENV